MNNSLINWIFLLIFFLSYFNKVYSVSTCTTELEKCTSAVNPLLKNVSYMFPTTKDEVVKMCSTWSSIVDCVRHFVKKCFNKQRKQTFNLAVESSIGTVHSICSSDTVQKEYLANAACFRDVSVKNCNFYYNQLVDIVANTKAQDEHICCAYAKFRQCVDIPLTAQCGQTVRNLMDHSLAFLIQKCKNPNNNLFSNYEQCQLPSNLVSQIQHTNRKLEETIDTVKTSGGFYPNNPNFINPYLIKSKEKKSDINEPVEEGVNEMVNNDSNRSDRSLDSQNNDEDFHVNGNNNKIINKFNRQDEDLEMEKHKDLSTESPEYMMSHLLPEELHNNSFLIYDKTIYYLPIVIYLIRKNILSLF